MVTEPKAPPAAPRGDGPTPPRRDDARRAKATTKPTKKPATTTTARHADRARPRARRTTDTGREP